VLVVDETSGTRHAFAISPTPISQADRLRRAGPDAAMLRPKRIVMFGAGAVGSHVGSLMARSGVGRLVVVDGDIKLPAGVVRHAGTAVGIGKAADLRDMLAPFDWTTVEVVDESPWDLDRLGALIAGADLCIDATGLTPFAELLSRIAARQEIPMVTVALYRGGRLARVRRQGPGDHPIAYRTEHWRYPLIPAGGDRSADFVGAETGCAAPIHNAPPAAVTAAASLAALVAIDLLTGRMTYPDEIIDVLEPIEQPFTTRGRHAPEPPTVMITEPARRTMITAAAHLHPNETGGVLVGVLDDTGSPCITEAVELQPDQPSTDRYEVPEGRTTTAVDAARHRDRRVGYLGEWHSHPTDQPASATDHATMKALSAHPDTGQPVLLVLRPTGPDTFTIDAYTSLDGDLLPASLIEVVPLTIEAGT
jgi:proteasome lid subunit RPN8/RPN11